MGLRNEEIIKIITDQGTKLYRRIHNQIRKKRRNEFGISFRL